MQSAFDAAATAGGVYLPKLYGIKAGIVVPGNIVIRGVTSGKDNEPVSGLKALSGFTSAYTMTHHISGSPVTYNVAGMLLSKSWVNNSNADADPIVTDGIYLDGNNLTDNRSAPIHGFIFCNTQNLFGDDVRVFNTTGFGVWLNSLFPNGTFAQAMVNNVIGRVRVGNTGSSSSTTYTTNGGSFPYAAIQCGALREVRDTSDQSESGRITDGVINMAVCVSPVYGDGIVVTNGGGWRIAMPQTNGAGWNGIYFEQGFQSVILAPYVDGYGTTCPASSGELSGIAVKSVLSGGCVQIIHPRVRIRPATNTSGNTFSDIWLDGPSSGLGVGIVDGLYSITRADAIGAVTAYSLRLTGGGASGTTRYHVTNSYAGDRAHWLRNTFGTSVALTLDGNSWQYSAAAPTTNWWPQGVKVFNASASGGLPLGWVTTAAGTPPTTRPFAPIPMRAEVTYNPPSIATASMTSTAVTVTGALLGDLAVATFDKDIGGLQITAAVNASNTVTVVMSNLTGASIDPVTGQLTVLVYGKSSL